MKGVKKKTLKPGPFNIKIYGRGLIRGYLILILLFLIVAALITYTSISENFIPLATSIIMTIGIVYSSIYCAIHIRSKGWLHGGIIGIVYVLILMLLSIFVVEGYSFNSMALPKVILGTGAGVIGGMLGINLK